MNAETDKFNIYENIMKDERNVPNQGNNKIVTMREYARLMASTICQSNQIENDFKEILKQNEISSEELRKIQSSCELYNKMSVLINDWNNFLLHWQMNEHSWRANIANENQKRISNPII